MAEVIQQKATLHSHLSTDMLPSKYSLRWRLKEWEKKDKKDNQKKSNVLFLAFNQRSMHLTSSFIKPNRNPFESSHFMSQIVGKIKATARMNCAMEYLLLVRWSRGDGGRTDISQCDDAT